MTRARRALGQRLDVGTLNGYREAIPIAEPRPRVELYVGARGASYLALYRQLWSSSKRQAANEIDQSSCIEG